SRRVMTERIRRRAKRKGAAAPTKNPAARNAPPKMAAGWVPGSISWMHDEQLKGLVDERMVDEWATASEVEFGRAASEDQRREIRHRAMVATLIETSIPADP